MNSEMVTVPTTHCVNHSITDGQEHVGYVTNDDRRVILPSPIIQFQSADALTVEKFSGLLNLVKFNVGFIA